MMLVCQMRLLPRTQISIFHPSIYGNTFIEQGASSNQFAHLLWQQNLASSPPHQALSEMNALSAPRMTCPLPSDVQCGRGSIRALCPLPMKTACWANAVYLGPVASNMELGCERTLLPARAVPGIIRLQCATVPFEHELVQSLPP